nr:hypothetical protein [Paenibacillus turpanensis]
MPLQERRYLHAIAECILTAPASRRIATLIVKEELAFRIFTFLHKFRIACTEEVDRRLRDRGKQLSARTSDP